MLCISSSAIETAATSAATSAYTSEVRLLFGLVIIQFSSHMPSYNLLLTSAGRCMANVQYTSALHQPKTSVFTDDGVECGLHMQEFRGTATEV